MSQPDVCANCGAVFSFHAELTGDCFFGDTRWFPSRLADAVTKAKEGAAPDLNFSTLPVQCENDRLYECRDCFCMVRSGSETKHAEVCGKRKA